MGVALESTGLDEVLALRIAREIAMDLHDIETILKNNQVEAQTWDKLQANRYFQALVAQAVADWNSALNTNERTKLKAASLVEEWLPEANRLAHDPKQLLSAKVELMKLLKSIGGVGVNPAGEGPSERFSVTINLGADAKLKFEKTVTPQVIEGGVQELSNGTTQAG